MASSPSEEQQPKRDSSGPSPSSEANHQPQRRGPQPTSQSSPAPGYPPAMGYPPQMVYSHGQPGPYNYQQMGYPNGHNHQYHYAQAPPAAYYNPHYRGYQPQRERDSCSGFARGILAALVLVVVLIFLSSVISWLILRPELPVFRVDTLSVTNFKTTIPFTANWESQLSVENPNQKLKVYFDRIESQVFYDASDVLGLSYEASFYLETQSKTTLIANISTNGSVQNSVPVWVAQEMEKERGKTGSVTFSLRLYIWSTFKTGSWWSRSASMRVLCEDLKVNFAGPSSSNGTLDPQKRDDCMVLV